MVKEKRHADHTEKSTVETMGFYRYFRCVVVLVSIILTAVTSDAQDISIGLMPRKMISSVLFSPSNGSYVLLDENADTLYRFRSDDALSISILGEQLLVKTPYGLNDTVRKASVVGNGISPSYRIRFNDEKQDHGYIDRLNVSLKDGKLLLVNKVSMERYVGRVVQGEVGHGAAEEYYKIQSIICRTYATRHLERHALDGYDLCDNEHCQVFTGLKKTSDEVVKATAATSGLVMVDPENKLILSAFHANCGGQTANSENVWKESRSYLTAVNDTFCLKSRSAVWDKSMPVTELLVQLGFATDTTGLDGWKFEQENRKKYFTLKKDSIETAQMRRLLQLRSTYFDLLIKDGKAEFTGRGYGHGVGLCQQGAMKMAESGYTFGQILGYYYKGVSLIPFTSLKP